MRINFISLLTSAIIALTTMLPTPAAVTVQGPGNVVGTGTNAWSYLVLEGEDYDSDVAADSGFTRVDATTPRTNLVGSTILAANTTASKKGALFTDVAFGRHIDKVTYQVQFARAGTYYLYMRFTMFENAENTTYLNEDSFFLPPAFDKDPQNDWPLMDATGQNGGYVEGCCDGGFLTINGVTHNAGDEEGRAFWEGNFHWNYLQSSQFLNVETQGEPRVRFKYEVTEAMLNKPLSFTVSYREGGVTIDQWVFSTNPDLMDQHTEAQLDQFFAPIEGLTVQDPGNVVGTGTNAWSYLVLEAEEYDSETSSDAGFVRVDTTAPRTNLVGSTILAANTTASKRGALFGDVAFGRHIDKVTYNVQFARAGTYYLYMRFTMFENAENTTYLNEDSFFLPPAFDKDPQNDWPLMDGTGQNGGYAEGCCDGGFLTINGVTHNAGDEEGRAFWEGNFHWNYLQSSQFLNVETQGEPRVRFKYEVTEAMVGKPLSFTVSYREGGATIDQWVFSTNPDLMDQYTEVHLDQLFAPVEGVTVQDPGNVVGTGTNAWSYLILEGEDYDSETSADAGFTRVDATTPRTNLVGSTILAANTTASKKGALFGDVAFGRHIDKVTYQVQFARAGTYYLYMRFTMFENAENTTYLNEDSFFLPPAFDKDPQNDWPLMDGTGQNGGYAEGCCDGGFLTINGVTHNAGDEEGRAFWEGNFHWNYLQSSQFLNVETQGEPRVRFKYEVTEAMVGKPLTFTVSYREGGATIDLWLFSTNPDLMDQYTEAQLDQILLSPIPGANPALAISRNGNNVVLSWPASAAGFALETSATLSNPTWSAVTTAPVVNGNQNTVTINASTGAAYYRLRKP